MRMPGSEVLPRERFRLPFQAVLIGWAWWYTRQPEAQAGEAIASQVKSPPTP